jgi:hypothetical protein
MSKQKKKRNHWVPQSYLRSFAADGERKKIWTFGKNGGDFELRPIKKVAVKFYLYAPKGPQGRDYAFEDKLASLEEMFGEEFWKAVCTGFVNLGDEAVRKALSLLTAVMWMRNPLHLQSMHDIHSQIVDFIQQAPELPDEIELNGKVVPIDKGSWPAYRDAGEDDIKRMWLKHLGSATWLAELLMKMRWSILLSEKPVFITSDHPVVALHPTLRFRGIKNPETTLAFPLSPTRVLHMDNRHSEPDNQYYPLKVSPGYINSLMWRYALNSMFSSRPIEEVCAEMCAEAEAQGYYWQPGGWLPDGEIEP